MEYAEGGSRVVIVASEPITKSKSDWVAVPANHALVVTREENGYMNVLHSPIYMTEPAPRLEEVATCLASVHINPGPHGAALYRCARVFHRTCCRC